MALIKQDEIYDFVDQAVGSRPEAVGDILDALITAIGETSEHVRTTWQDEGMAKAWDRIGNAVGKAKDKYTELKPF